MTSFININGKLQASEEAAIRVDDRAFRFGYGLFETMLVKDGNIQLEALHLKRLFDGLALLQINAPEHFQKTISKELWRTISKNKLEKLARVRLQLSAGHGGFYEGDSFVVSYVIEVFPLEPSILDLNEAGLVTGIANPIKHTGPYAQLKSCNALHYALAARQAKKSLWNDALLLNERGNLVESSIANLFWIKDNDIFTPPLSEGCIAGVIRQYLIDVLPEWGYRIHEQAGNRTIVRNADAVFITNSIRGIRWIRSIDQIEYGPASIPMLHLKLMEGL